MKYLIDTDWAIDHLNGVEKITQKLEELSLQGLALSIISLAELYEGVYSSNKIAENEKALKKFLEGISILTIDDETCKIFAKEGGKLRRKKDLIGDFDLLIASTCFRHNLTLLTNNIKHFEKIKRLETLSRLQC